MKQAKRILAVLLAMVLLCGFATVGAFAADAKVIKAAAPAAAELPTLTDAQLKKLNSALQGTIPLAVLEVALGQVPSWLKWTAFSKGSSYAALEADLAAELKKAGLSADDLLKWMAAGEILEHIDDIILYNQVMAEKGPEILKKHCVFYIDWLVDCLAFTGKLFGPKLAAA